LTKEKVLKTTNGVDVSQRNPIQTKNLTIQIMENKRNTRKNEKLQEKKRYHNAT
jgi:hypothetical protein